MSLSDILPATAGRIISSIYQRQTPAGATAKQEKHSRQVINHLASVGVAAPTHLTQTILERQRFNAQRLHALQLFLVKVFQFVHGDVTVAVQVHTSAQPQKRIKSNCFTFSDDDQWTVEVFD